MGIYESGLETYSSHDRIMKLRILCPIRIGGRMGKPEGSKLREMKPAIHCNYPVGFNVGSTRLMRSAADNNDPTEIGIRMCDECDTETIWCVCCGKENQIL